MEDVSARAGGGATDIASGGTVARKRLIGYPVPGRQEEYARHVRSREKSNTCEDKRRETNRTADDGGGVKSRIMRSGDGCKQSTSARNADEGEKGDEIPA